MKHVIQHFQIFGDYVSGERYGTGHINDTYKVVCNVAGTEVPYLLQRINHNVFKHPDQVQENILRVTQHVAGKLGDAPDASRGALTIVPALAGKPYWQDDDGNWWRMYLFIVKARTFDTMQTPEQAFEVGRSFAAFQNLLADFPEPRLHETIPGFHHGVKRFEAFQAALHKDEFNRAAGVKPQIAFFEQRAEQFSHLLDRQACGEIPERITHNDTKLNNIMLDDATGRGICVIDLDTVMPGLALYDFGDMCRSGTAVMPEDSQDLEKVRSDVTFFKAIAGGYCSAAKFLTAAEKEELAFSARLITMIIGVRFLTDYLSGDRYFHIAREGQNLDRCRVQQKMAQSMEEQSEQMESIIKEVCNGSESC